MKNIIWRVHAIRRMISRNISREEVIFILYNKHDIVQSYDNDKPYPSKLILGFTNIKRPLHIVYAKDEADNYIVITVYEPGKDLWMNDLKTRRKF